MPGFGRTDGDPVVPPHRVVVLAIPRVVAFDLSIAAQVFAHPDERDRYSFELCTPRPGLVPSSTGFSIDVVQGLSALESADTVIVPGFHPMTEVEDSVIEALRQAAARGTRIASVCIGAFALAAAGLLDGLAATVHWAEADRFRALYPGVRLSPDVLYVDTGQVLTSAGLSAGIDLCIHIIRTDHGQQVAADVARRMVVAVHRAGGQVQYSRRPTPSDGGLGPTREWAIAQLQQPLTLGRLAGHAGIPVRSFSRQFRAETGTTAMRWLLGQRLQEVCRLLEATGLGIEHIADLTGLGSATTLRTHFERAMGCTPTQYRVSRRTTTRPGA